MEISSKSTNPVRGYSQWINLCAYCWSIFHLRGCRTCNELGWGRPQHSLNNCITEWSYQWDSRTFKSGALDEEMRSLYYLVLLARISGSLCSSVIRNIAKGTTDPRVEFISQDHSSPFTNVDYIAISECPRLSINFKTSTKHQHVD